MVIMTESYDCEGNEIKVEYDILGRKTALESRDSGRYIYEYNGEGKLQYESNSRLIAEGKRIGYFYDSFGRLSKIDYPDAKETVYEYGSPDTGEENAKNRLRSRLYVSGQVNDDWSYTARLENNQEFNGAGKNNVGEEDTKLNQAWVNG